MANGIFENVSNHFGSLCLSPVPFSSCSLFYSSSSICSKMNLRARFCSSNKHRSEIPSFFSVRRCQVSGFLAWYMRQPKLAINREQKNKQNNNSKKRTHHTYRRKKNKEKEERLGCHSCVNGFDAGTHLILLSYVKCTQLAHARSPTTIITTVPRN